MSENSDEDPAESMNFWNKLVVSTSTRFLDKITFPAADHFEEARHRIEIATRNDEAFNLINALADAIGQSCEDLPLDGSLGEVLKGRGKFLHELIQANLLKGISHVISTEFDGSKLISSEEIFQTIVKIISDRCGSQSLDSDRTLFFEQLIDSLFDTFFPNKFNEMLFPTSESKMVGGLAWYSIKPFHERIYHYLKNKISVKLADTSLYELLNPLFSDTEAERLTRLNTLSGSTLLSKLSRTLPSDLIKYITEHPEKLGKFLPESENPEQLLHSTLLLIKSCEKQLQIILSGLLQSILDEVAQQNRPNNGKDSALVLAEKLEAFMMSFIRSQYINTSSKELASELIESSGLNVLPQDFAKPIKKLESLIAEFFIESRYQLCLLNPHTERVQNSTFDLQQLLPKAIILAEDLARFIITATPFVLAEMTPCGKRFGLVGMTFDIREEIEDHRDNGVLSAKVLLDYDHTNKLQELASERLRLLAEEPSLDDFKETSVQFLKHGFQELLYSGISKLFDFEQKKGKAATQPFVVHALSTVANHMRVINEIRQRDGSLSFEAFKQAIGELHEGIPKGPVQFPKTMQALSTMLGMNIPPAFEDKLRKMAEDELRKVELLNPEKFSAAIELELTRSFNEEQRREIEGILSQLRLEAQSHQQQRKNLIYRPISKAFLEYVYPEGAADLDFFPQQNVVWENLKKHIMPLCFYLITDVLLDADTLEELMVASLEEVLENLQETSLSEKEKSPIFEDVARELIVETMTLFQFPTWVTNMAKSSRLPQTLNGVITNKINDTFLQVHIPLLIKSMVKRKADGDYLLRFNAISKAERRLKIEKERPERRKRVKQLFRDVAEAAIQSFFATAWRGFQRSFDNFVYEKLGPRVVVVKGVLDRTLRFIFIKCIGSLLSLLFRPIKSALYTLSGFDAKIDKAFSWITAIPKGQPGKETFSVVLEDLLYKVVLKSV